VGALPPELEHPLAEVHGRSEVEQVLAEEAGPGAAHGELLSVP
jgi:hypothetical protein